MRYDTDIQEQEIEQLNKRVRQDQLPGIFQKIVVTPSLYNSVKMTLP